MAYLLIRKLLFHYRANLKLFSPAACLKNFAANHFVCINKLLNEIYKI